MSCEKQRSSFFFLFHFSFKKFSLYTTETKPSSSRRRRRRRPPLPFKVLHQPLPQEALDVLRLPVVDPDRRGRRASASTSSTSTSSSAAAAAARSSRQPLPLGVQEINPRRGVVPVPEPDLPPEQLQLVLDELVYVAVRAEARAADLENRGVGFGRRRVEGRGGRRRGVAVVAVVVRSAAAAAVRVDGGAFAVALAAGGLGEGRGQRVAGGAERVGEPVVSEEFWKRRRRVFFSPLVEKTLRRKKEERNFSSVRNPLKERPLNETHPSLEQAAASLLAAAREEEKDDNDDERTKAIKIDAIDATVAESLRLRIVFGLIALWISLPGARVQSSWIP